MMFNCERLAIKCGEEICKPHIYQTYGGKVCIYYEKDGFWLVIEEFMFNINKATDERIEGIKSFAQSQYDEYARNEIANWFCGEIRECFDTIEKERNGDI